MIKRKDVILRKALVIIAIVVTTAVITRVYDSYAYGKDIQELEEKNIIMPDDKWGAIMMYDDESGKIVKYIGLMTFEEIEIMGESGVSISCSEAKFISSMAFNKEAGANK